MYLSGNVRVGGFKNNIIPYTGSLSPSHPACPLCVLAGPMAGKMFFKLSKASIDSDLAMLSQDGKTNDKDSSSAQGRELGVRKSGISNPGDGHDGVAEGGTVGGNGGRRFSPVPSGASRTSSMPKLGTVNGGSGSNSSSISNKNSTPGKRKRTAGCPISSEDAPAGVENEAGDGGASTRSKTRSKTSPKNDGSGKRRGQHWQNGRWQWGRGWRSCYVHGKHVKGNGVRVAPVALVVVLLKLLLDPLEVVLAV